ncbi:MAG: hypothetical protein NTU89_03620 [Candidatus Dependentiae bacterium]|nr:hypothetical protein [Candidatus Dependentiae bacterium]
MKQDTGKAICFVLETAALNSSEIVLEFPEIYERQTTMYTKEQFGYQLKRLTAEQTDINLISDWAHELYAQYLTDPGSNLDDILLVLAMMDAGPEFELSYERLNEIADRLIAGKDVKL